MPQTLLKGVWRWKIMKIHVFSSQLFLDFTRGQKNFSFMLFLNVHRSEHIWFLSLFKDTRRGVCVYVYIKNFRNIKPTLIRYAISTRHAANIHKCGFFQNYRMETVSSILSREWNYFFFFFCKGPFMHAVRNVERRRKNKIKNILVI